MRSTAALAAILAIAANAQKGLNSPGGKDCQKGDPVVPKDPSAQFNPDNVKWPCDFGSKPIPMGPAPEGCSKYEVIIARGTSEPGPFGTVVGDPLMAAVKRGMPNTDVRGYAVQYPAAKTGVEIGSQDLVNRLKKQSQACPNQTFALAGYSQGGRVIGLAAPNIPDSIQGKIVAVVLYGAATGKGLPPAMKSKLLSNCAPGDFGCGTQIPGPGHLSYNNVGTKWHEKSSQFIASAFQGKPMPAKNEFSPTR